MFLRHKRSELDSKFFIVGERQIPKVLFYVCPTIFLSSFIF